MLDREWLLLIGFAAGIVVATIAVGIIRAANEADRLHRRAAENNLVSARVKRAIEGSFFLVQSQINYYESLMTCKDLPASLYREIRMRNADLRSAFELVQLEARAAAGESLSHSGPDYSGLNPE